MRGTYIKFRWSRKNDSSSWQRQKPGYTASKILNFKKEDPEAFQRTDQFLLVHNYINYYLSDGVLAMEPGDASGTALMQISDLNWCEKLCRLIDPSLTKKLPKITAPNRFIGKISKTLASRFGISPDCQIDPGSGDNMFGAIGTGNVQEGVVTISLGTSGTAYAFSEKLYLVWTEKSLYFVMQRETIFLWFA